MNDLGHFKPTSPGRIINTMVLSVMGIVLALSGCGGGGGGGSSNSTATPAAQSISLSATPIAINGTTGVAKDSTTTVSVNFTPSGFATSSATDFKVTGDFTVTCNGVKQSSLTGAWVVAATAPNSSTYVATSSVAVTGAPSSAPCTMAANVAAVRGTVASNTIPINVTFTTVAAPVCTGSARLNSVDVCIAPPGAVQDYIWNDVIKAWVANIGVLVTGANTLPDTCFLVGDACWKENVANGKIKFVNSGIVQTGINTRPIVFAYFIVGGFSNGNSAAGYHNTMPIYADLEGPSPLANQGTSNGSLYAAVPTVRGTATGLKFFATGLTPGTTPTGTACYERTFFSNGFGTTATTCPI